MEPREIDKLIHKKVFGYKIDFDKPQPEHFRPDKTSHYTYLFDVPHYSTQIEDAWKVVRQIQGSHFFTLKEWGGDNWNCILENFVGDNFVRVEAETAPMAIAKACLKLYEEK